RHEERAAHLELVAATLEPEAAADFLTSFTIVERILARGEGLIKLGFHGGVPCLIHLVAPEAFAAARFYYTASAGHLAQCQKLAREQGLEIAEGGVIIMPDGSRFWPASEAEIYDLLHLPYMPPELRNGTGEIEAALSGRLPDLIEADDMRGDLHVHSNYSDGGWSLSEIAAAAREKGWEYIAVCDHSPLLAMAGGLSREKLVARNQEIRRLNQEGGVTLLAGAEVDIRADGSLDYPDDCLAELDIVIASMHTGFQQDRTRLMERLAKAMRHPHVHIIGHPLGRMLDQRAGFDLDPAEVIRLAAETGTALEINTSPHRLDLPDIYAKMAKDEGVCLAINNDAHERSELEHLEYGIGLARRAWLEPSQVLNCLPLAKLRQQLQQKRSRA
ncbi:MAG TPA: PHP domain-containing protein, partial [Firmicutes bacterium]|nr:PHP domain-containing protein [Bacillota bacterium]